MMNSRVTRLLWILAAVTTGAALAAIPVVAHSDDAPAAVGTSVDPDADYDRLDGHGTSGKRVNVIEWEGNLEVHVYPAGSLKGLALKLDQRNKGRPVMVIGYRFNDSPGTQLIRRAILGIGLRKGFRAYRDPSAEADGYDKIVISNNGLASPLALYRLEAEPKQLYPDGHPALNQAAQTGVPAVEKRVPAASAARESTARAAKAPAASAGKEPADDSALDDNGTIRPFFSK